MRSGNLGLRFLLVRGSLLSVSAEEVCSEEKEQGEREGVVEEEEEEQEQEQEEKQ